MKCKKCKHKDSLHTALRTCLEGGCGCRKFEFDIPRNFGVNITNWNKPPSTIDLKLTRKDAEHLFIICKVVALAERLYDVPVESKATSKRILNKLKRAGIQ